MNQGVIQLSKRKERKMPRAATSDLGPLDDDGKPWRAQHGGIELEAVSRALRGGVTEVRAHVRVECILDAYWRRMQIIDRQHEAGMVFRSYWLRSVQMPRVSADYGTRVSGGVAGDDLPAGIANAKRRIRELTNRLTVEQALAVTAVCGMDEWAGGTRRLDALREGLTAMADYLRLEMPEKKPN